MSERIGIKYDDDEKQKSLVSHFVGNWLLEATHITEDGGNADKIKAGLLLELETSVKGSIVDEVLTLIRNSDWSTQIGLENFREKYQKFESKHGI